MVSRINSSELAKDSLEAENMLQLHHERKVSHENDFMGIKNL